MAASYKTYCKSCGAMGFSGTKCEYCGNILPFPKGVNPPQPHSISPPPAPVPLPMSRPATTSVLPSQRQKSESWFSYIWKSEPSEEVSGLIWLLFIGIGVVFYFLSNMEYSAISSDEKLYTWIGIVAAFIVSHILNNLNLRIMTAIFLIGTIAITGYMAKDSYSVAINNEKVITDSIIAENTRMDSLRKSTYRQGHNAHKHKRRHRHRRH